MEGPFLEGIASIRHKFRYEQSLKTNPVTPSPEQVQLSPQRDSGLNLFEDSFSSCVFHIQYSIFQEIKRSKLATHQANT